MYDTMCNYIGKINTSQKKNQMHFQQFLRVIYGGLFLNERCMVFNEFT